MPLGDNTRLTTEEFISRSNLVHNFFYDYSKTQYIDSKKKVIIICPIHGDFLQRPSNHINLKQGCYYCGNDIKSKTLLRAQRDFINISKNIHGDKYNYDKVDYKGSTKKVTIICPIHGEFHQTPSAHIVQKQGCPICGNARKNNTRQIDVKEFIDKANIIHKNKYTYKTETFVNMTTKMSIICPIHGDFWQQPNNHNNRQGCPMCKKSYGEIQIREYLIKKNEIFKQQFRFKGCRNKKTLPFDFFLPNKKICIEYDGIQHFEKGSKYYSDSIVTNDKIKNEYCKKNNIKLIRIPYWDFDNIDKILNFELDGGN